MATLTMPGVRYFINNQNLIAIDLSLISNAFFLFSKQKKTRLWTIKFNVQRNFSKSPTLIFANSCIVMLF